MRPSEILSQHEKGKAYRHLLEGCDVFPIVIDSNRTVASMPPIINSQTTGKVTEKTKNLFVEVTGFNWRAVQTALEVVCMALADRGGKIYSCKVHFPSDKKPYPAKEVFTPSFDSEKLSFDKSIVLKKTGLDLKDKEVIGLLERARFDAKIVGNKVHVVFPSYRVDIMHPVDVVEDLLISYGFNNIVPELVEMSVVGSELKESRFLDFVREGCIGLALQEVLTYNLSSKQVQGVNLFSPNEDFVEIANPVSLNYEIFRKRLSPQLLDFISKNKDKEFPQRVFEVGSCLEIDSNAENGVKQSNHVCVVLSHSNVNFTEAKSFLVSLCSFLGYECAVKKKQFSFLNDNSAEIIVNGKKGFIGELKKEVVDSFGLRKPVALFEFEL
jgi:phenylalanyl-tRNA synthetase beta chain